ncbi:MAG: DUF4190 domain-containing protein [Candidatus Woesearchaeota archaeon]
MFNIRGEYVPEKTSDLARASLVLGIISLTLSWMPIFGWLTIIIGIPAIVFGIIAIVKISKGPSSPIKGMVMAITGVILGGISFVIFVLRIGFSMYIRTLTS